MAKFPNISDLTECPLCGGDEYYVIARPIGTIITHYRFDGGDADNTEMYANLSDKPQKFVYCSNCQVKIARNNKE
ncbi:hypothetical protein [Sulfurimonas sp.]